MNLKKLLFDPIDNSALIVFRIFFGILITIEAWGAIATGWVRRTMVEPEATFNFIGFDFLQFFQGPPMYFYFGLMGVFGLMVTIGYRYRWSMFSYALLWAGAYLMQKSSYNNHYYLLMLLCGIMTLLPAGANVSVDTWLNPKLKKISMPRWVVIIIIIQLWIVYTYASIAKLYPDWLDSTVPELLMKGRKKNWPVGWLLQDPWAHWTIAYIGILFDGLIIPLLLWKKTRKWAFGISIFFHLFNSIVFRIGIFPYMSLAFSLFFFETKTIHQLFLKRWKPYFIHVKERTEAITSSALSISTFQKASIFIFGIYFMIQIALPLRHWFIEDNVLWTEEGHRLSWRMMLRTKSGRLSFTGKDKETGVTFKINHRDYLSKKQQSRITTKPDMIWQLAQRIKKKYASQGQDIAIYARSRVRINGRPYRRFIDPKVDLASVPWKHFEHNPWLLPSGDYLLKKETPSK